MKYKDQHDGKKLRSKIATAAAAMALLWSSAAWTQEITIFGVPLGGKLTYQVRACPASSRSAQICWVGKPFVWQGGKLGSVTFPDERIPTWSSYGTFELSLSKDNVILHISVKNLPLRLENEVVTSLERRFGTPRTLSKSFEGSVTGWKKDDIEIEMICPSTTACNIRFLSAKQAAEIADRQAKHERKQLARPLSP